MQQEDYWNRDDIDWHENNISWKAQQRGKYDRRGINNFFPLGRRRPLESRWHQDENNIRRWTF
jgi:hypothetical protein